MALRLMRTAFDRRRSDPLPYLCRRLTRMRAIDRQNDPQLDANLANALVDRHRDHHRYCQPESQWWCLET
ncbi:hypothetical protein PGT21_031421 [Puccinia graminis f. sp. tritici]|uniref:Uncharacterized protein n=1 Tax=Puccinia graminis f. sp. tritici TaxID=56615 RepID=A0A5B0QZ50_PUCGR|nr:hypothetical protein PGT21_031421 [Puccinia graminis f. sp. tritici]